MPRHQLCDQSQHRSGDTQRHSSGDQLGREVCVHVVRGARQVLCNAVPRLAKRIARPTNEFGAALALGTKSIDCPLIQFTNRLLTQSQVHYSYGEDLGLTSDDEEEYYSDNLVHTLSSNSNPMAISGSDTNSSDQDLAEQQVLDDCLGSKAYSVGSELTDSIEEVAHECQCVQHEGKLIIDSTFAVPVDRLFQLIFTDSKFLHDLHKSRRTHDLRVSQWDDSEDNDKSRQLTYTVALNHALVKSARTVEWQRLLARSSGHKFYTIKSMAENEGVPYCDTFAMHSVWCLSQEGPELTRLRVHAKVVFNKSSWSLNLMKPLIEKSSIQGITDFCTDLSKHLPVWLQMESDLGLLANDPTNGLEVEPQCRARLPIDSSESSLNESSHVASKVSKASHPSHSSRPNQRAFNSGNDRLIIKIIIALLLLSLILNVVIMFRIRQIESIAEPNDTSADQSISEFSPNSLRLFIDKTIHSLKNIESNLLKVKNRIKDEL